MNKRRVYRRNGNVITRCIAGETILVPVSGQLADMRRLYSLNRVAEYIWERIDGEAELAVVRQEILDRFEVDEAKADGEIQAFVDSLLAAGLIHEVS